MTRCVANVGRSSAEGIDNTGEGFAGRIEMLYNFQKIAVRKTNSINLDLSKLWSDLTLSLCDQGLN